MEVSRQTQGSLRSDPAALMHNFPYARRRNMQFERKGGREVLRAFAALRSRRPDAELWIVGPQHLRVDEPGVRVLGRVRRADAPGGMPDLYRRATLLAMPSPMALRAPSL